jgi:long-chain acyl-CoA synthetase
MSSDFDIVSVGEARTLAGLFRERIHRSPDAIAYQFYDTLNEVWTDYSWSSMEREVARWQSALEQEKLKPGDKVAIMARNSRFWVMFDQAALGLGLVVVPLYTEDQVDSVIFILKHAEVKLLVIGGVAQWERLKTRAKEFSTLKRIVSIGQISDANDRRMVSVSRWLPVKGGKLRRNDGQPDDLATIVYTSGTTGRPKGVMLSHRNILSNSMSGLQAVPVTTNDVFLSFLPLSHMLERTVGYYLPMMAGATVAHSRSIANLPEDLQVIKPTVIISVPRIFERMYARVKEGLLTKPAFVRTLFNLAVNIGWEYFTYQQGRCSWRASFILWPLLKRLVADKINERLGGRIRVAISGGAALAPEISKVFVGLGVPILQGYGLTEASPVVSVNKLGSNIPASIGPPLPEVEVKLGGNGELLTRSKSVMLGYWKEEAATREIIDKERWLHTGDKARIEDNHIYITGRLKEIIVMATGEKVSPLDIELAITTDHLFEQIMIVGESRPYLTAIAVLNKDQLDKLIENETQTIDTCSEEAIEGLLLERIANKLKMFPDYAQIHRVTCTREHWEVDNGLLTPTLKIKRNKLHARYVAEIEHMYEGHTF